MVIQWKWQISSVQFSCSVVSKSLWPHGPQHARPPCPSPTPGVYPNSCPLSQWCHPTISSSVIPFFSCLQSFPASGSFQMSQLFASGGQSIAVSASTSVLPMSTQDWFHSGWTGRISLQPKDSQDLNQIPYDYTVEVTNRFKELDLLECLKNYWQKFLTFYMKQGSRTSPRKRNAKRQNGCLRRTYK